MRNDVAIIALKYLEPEYAETVKCIEATGLDVYWADRDGVGNMSRAFNEAFKLLPQPYKYVWFITNILFKPETPLQLADNLDAFRDLAAIHPACDSDHPFLRQQYTGLTRTVPLIELMAPMFRTKTFAFSQRFCEQTPYWYMDLIISDQLKQQGHSFAVDDGSQVHHKYLRNSKKHTITLIREQLRDYMTRSSKAHMVEHYGPDWEQKLRYQYY